MNLREWRLFGNKLETKYSAADEVREALNFSQFELRNSKIQIIIQPSQTKWWFHRVDPSQPG